MALDPRTWSTRGKVLAVAAVLLILLLLAPVVAPDAVAEFSDVILGSARVGPRTTVDSLGVVPDDPYDLARAANLPPDVYAQAREIASEAGRGSPEEKAAKAWVAVNDANALGWDLVKLLTYHKTPARAGKFGKQISGRYATGSDPREDDVTIAQGVLARLIPDPTGGATKFLDADSFAAQAGTSGTAEAKDAEWLAAGYERADVDGVSTWFYRPQTFG